MDVEDEVQIFFHRFFQAFLSKQKLFSQTDGQKDRPTFHPSYQNKSFAECQQDVKKSVRQTGKYTVRQADRVTERQDDSMTVWQNSRAAKQPALVYSRTLPCECINHISGSRGWGSICKFLSKKK